MAEFLGAAFIPYYGHLIEILETNPEMKKSAKGIFQQMAWGAGGTAMGGVLLGPAGALVGGLAGSLIGYMKSDNYQALIVVMKNLSDSEKKRIVQKVQELVGSVGVEELVRFVGSQVQRDALLQLLRGALNDIKGG
ncbi:uncharacterized protein LOC110445536 [Mizuhopecten yessoensis]|uniref:uncharacterized protein LOC110445536 n=1 Tax=Mizuhopecten yessoensis TaxID=6573 RepID=UPI000B45ACC2|nr:uncharacterized protein LOC110445536 [Mizuhopecten yessoensis]